MAISKRRLWIGAGVVVVWSFVLSVNRDEPSPRCEVAVTTDVLEIHSSPEADASVIDQLGKGDVVEADDAIRNGFRQVGEDRWASAQSLIETPGSDCD